MWVRASVAAFGMLDPALCVADFPSGLGAAVALWWSSTRASFVAAAPGRSGFRSACGHPSHGHIVCAAVDFNAPRAEPLSALAARLQPPLLLAPGFRVQVDQSDGEELHLHGRDREAPRAVVARGGRHEALRGVDLCCIRQSAVAASSKAVQDMKRRTKELVANGGGLLVE